MLYREIISNQNTPADDIKRFVSYYINNLKLRECRVYNFEIQIYMRNKLYEKNSNGEIESGRT